VKTIQKRAILIDVLICCHLGLYRTKKNYCDESKRSNRK
jgi:hypothetical protein